MASGRLGVAAPAAATLTQVYAGPPAGLVATANIVLVNTGTNPVTVRIAISTAVAAGSVVVADYIMYGRSLNAGDEYEHSGIAMSSGESVWVYVSAATVSVRVHGFEA